jgi:integrase
MATIQKLERKNGARYRVLIRRTGHKPVTRVFDRKRDADEWARLMEGDLNRVDDLPAAAARRHRLADVIDSYLEGYTGKDQIVLSRLAWWRQTYGDLPLSKVTQSIIKDGLRKLASEPARTHAGKGQSKSLDRPRTPATVNRYHVALSTALEWARREGLLTRNPARGIQRKTEPRGRVRWLSDDERQALLTACDASTWADLGLLVRLALSTGARLSELLNLRRRDLDFDRRLAFVQDSKNSDRRALPLVPAVLTLLEAKRQLPVDALLFPASRDADKPHSFRNSWTTAVEAAGLADFRFHDLRHSCASYLAMSGASAVEIADILGHRTLAMVQRYSHLSTDHKARLLERVTGPMVEGGSQT